MKKYITLLFIANHALMLGMGNTELHKKLLLKYSHPTPLTKSRKDIREFENKIKFDHWEEHADIPLFQNLFTGRNMSLNTDIFFQYCYYRKIHKIDSKSPAIAPLWLPKNHYALKRCQESRIDDYSPLGITMLTKDASIEEKRQFVQELFNDGFQPTPKDVELAKLILYDNISARQKETIILWFCNYQKDNVSQLLPEIRKQIKQYMIQLFRNEFWLLPETALNDL